mmetsp:Transcript_9488/g.21803  ORF Transcript_9488/g.21803 Transcript_9488/m.21803 type:complete len:187 (+) Transcript_9488:3-563(+)
MWRLGLAFGAVASSAALGPAPSLHAPRGALLRLRRGGPSTESGDAPAGIFGPTQSQAGPAFKMMPRLESFCEQRDGTPACEAPPCCCWSTLSGVAHQFYADPSAAEAGRRCLNPPKGYRYAPQPGDVMDQGKFAQMELAGFPIYEGRTLCCVVEAGDLRESSLRDPHVRLQSPQGPPMPQSPPLTR